MMSNVAIRVQNIAKKYQIAAGVRRHDTLRDQLSDAVQSVFRRNASGARKRTDTFWSLKDISFDVKFGEVVGVIGRNGAGKSTLLKVLSRITAPTAGRVRIYGRVASLLEVGTGFHGELTGGENIYLNGAILGMKKAEIDRKFDEIVAFSEVEKFINTPVKRYSTGMHVRLAFAVAAHLEPEILLVDEVLAVGDAAFQKKCLSKMEEVGREGRTVLFVSHNMSSITRLCPRVIMLDRGQILTDGPAHEAVAAYSEHWLDTGAVHEWPDPAVAPGSDVVRLRAVRVRAHDGRIADSIDIRQPLGLEMEYEVLQPGFLLLPYFNLHNQESVFELEAVDVDKAWRGRVRPRGVYTSTAWIPGNLLADGVHFVSAGLTTLDPDSTQFHERDSVAFHVIDSLSGDSARGDWMGPLGGAAVRPLLEWTTSVAPLEERFAVTHE
jgi:lipopolysaccharide transport system ATP-binding protein